MLLRAMILAGALAPAEPAEAPVVTTSTAPAGLDVVIVRAPPKAEGELRDALRVRLPAAKVLPFRNESFAEIQGRPFVYLEITSDDAPDPLIHLLFVLSDGRAYVRDVQPERDQPARSIAATIAVTLGAIEEERLLPDRTEVQVPRPEPAPPAEPEPAPPAEPALAPEPAPAARSDPPPPPTIVERESIAHVGVGATVLGLFGIAPTTPTARFPVSAGLHVVLRLPIGVAVEAGLRGSTRAHAGYRLLRLRGQIGAGYVWARRRLELGAVAGPTVEGWMLRDPEGRAPSSGRSGDRLPPLFGGAAAITAGVLLPAWPSSRVTLRIAARGELAASALPSGSAARVIDVGPPPRAIFTAGGVEASLGLDLRVWIPIRRRSEARRLDVGEAH